MQLMEYVWHEMTAGFDFRVRFVPTLHLIEDAMADVPAEERTARFDQLAAGFGMPARLARAADLPEAALLKPEQRTSFDRGSIVSLDRDDGGFTLVRRLNVDNLAV